jgi:hypothetical protein
MSISSGILKEHMKCDMTEGSMRLRNVKFLVRGDEQGGNYVVNRIKLLDTFEFLLKLFELLTYCIKIIFFDMLISVAQDTVMNECWNICISCLGMLLLLNYI